MRTAYLLIIISLCALPSPSHGQTMQAVTTPPGAGLKVVITWPSNSPTERFNLYRKIAGAPAYPATPLNTVPVGRLSSCSAIKAVILPLSPEWKLMVNAIDPTAPFDPCKISTLASSSPQEKRLQFLARSHWKIAVVAGQGFLDTTVTNGTAYEYELRLVNALGVEKTPSVFTNIGVTAGKPKMLPAPTGLSATAGDSRVLLLWGNVNEAAGFVVSRSTATSGPYLRVNEADFLTQIKEDIDGKALPTPSNGFLDIQPWAGDGTPATHSVNGTNIDGPSNGVTYFYKVASLDLLGQQGPMSAAPVSAKPSDKTPPIAPAGVMVTAVDDENRLEVRWSVTNLDAEGHVEKNPIAQYRLYRYEEENAPLSNGTPVGPPILLPAPAIPFLTASDHDPMLRPPFGEKTFWYRVDATDSNHNTSARSVAVGGHLKDITAPAPPEGISAEGFDDFISVHWNANTEPDMDGYQIYRTLCDHGVANPCDPAPPRPGKPDQEKGEVEKKRDTNEVAPGTLSVRKKGGGEQKIPCTGEYVIVGSVSQADAKQMGATVAFEDHTVPKGSPLCYSYWIKAYDQAQNKSGDWPVPNPATEQTICQRLRDRTPPEPAIISALFARDQAIRVEWVGPPVQDIRAYQVYRSDTESGTYKWVGGMTVEPPPNVPQTLTAPYHPPALVACDEIPLIAIESMSMGYFVDRGVDPKSFYWYKVVGIDQSGNEAPLNKAAPVSTFTFTTRQPATPMITSVTGTTATPWALVVRWTPVFDPAQHKGFAVFRSEKSDGLYRQIGTLLNQAEYQDDHVVKNATYWYKIVLMDKTGQLSPLSPAASGMIPP